MTRPDVAAEAGEKVVARVGPTRIPSLIVLGAMRSGTTWLARVLEASDHVFVGEKEVHFFDRNFHRGVDWYAQHYRNARPGQLCCDATTNYLYHPELAERMKPVLPDPRFLVILRNPIDRAHSHYQQRRSYGDEPLTFEAALDAEADRIARGGIDRDLYSYQDRGHYVHQLEGYARVFGKERIFVRLYEEVFRDPRRAYLEIMGFIAGPTDSIPEVVQSRINQNNHYRSLLLRRMSRRFPRLLRNAIGRLNSKPLKVPPIAAETRRRLARRYRDDNAALSEWLGRDVLRFWSHS